MRTRLAAAAALLGAAAVGAGALPAPAAAGGRHPIVSIIVPVNKVEHGERAKAVLCWEHAPSGWEVRVSSANSANAAPTTVFSAPASPSTFCESVALPTDVQGAHPISATLLTPGGTTYAFAFSALYVYAPIQGSMFLKNILRPDCHGKGTVTIGGTARAWTCSMAAVTSHTTATPTSCRKATLKMASTDDPSGGGANKGSSIFELSQNVYKPAFKRFGDNVAVGLSVPLSGSGFWVAFKSTSASSRLYFLDAGATADCYTKNGVT